MGFPAASPVYDSSASDSRAREERFDQIVVEFGRRSISSAEDVQALIAEITESAASALGVQHSSLWYFSNDRSELRCENAFDREQSAHSKGLVLKRESLEPYLEALTRQRVVAVANVKYSPITRTFYQTRLSPMGVSALLDAPLWADGKLFGVVSFLHCGDERLWSREERAFASSIAEVIALALHAEERQAYERALRFRMELERLILTLTNQLIQVKSADVDAGLQSALAQLGSFAEVDRSYLFFFGEDRLNGFSRHEWCAPGIAAYRLTEELKRINFQSRFMQELLRGEVVHIPKIDGLHPDTYRETSEWRAQGIQSLVAVPLVSAGRTRGFLGFDSIRRSQAWSDDEIALLKIAGSMLLRIEERRRSEIKERALIAQVQHSQKLESLGVLAGGIAHDFNNLLMGVLGNSELLLRRLPPSGTQSDSNDLCVDYAKRIQLAARRAAELTQQLLAYSGKGQFSIEQVDISSVVRELEPLLRTAVAGHIELSFVLAGQPQVVMADVTQLRQLVLNLATNASEAIGDRAGKICVSTGVAHVDEHYLKSSYVDEALPAGDYVYLDIQDNGRGIPGEQLERIFDPFFTTKFTGRGLGLAVVMGMVRSHRGAIRVFSEPGVGTTFRVLLASQSRARAACELPDSAEAPRGDSESHTFETGSGESTTGDFLTDGEEPARHGIDTKMTQSFEDLGGLVLVVDDEEITMLATQDMLEASGFTVVTAINGPSALELFSKHRSELVAVILDMTMPKMSGVEVFTAMHALDPAIPVIFSSGYSEMDALERIRDLPIAGFIQKPFGLHVLSDAVKQAAKGRSASGD